MVGADGTVERIVTRREMRRLRLRTRVTMVAVLHAEHPELLVHRRSDDKDVLAGMWDFAFGGIAAIGETWEDAAVREFAEEAGVVVTPDELFALGPPVGYDDEVMTELARAWYVRSTGPFSFDPAEVAETAWVPLADLDRWITAEQVAPDTIAVLAPHLRQLTF